MKFNEIKIDLPSKGLVYSENSPFREGYVTFRYPTPADKDILTDMTLINRGEAIDEFLKNIMTNKEQKEAYSQLFVGDKDALLINSRILLEGPSYNVETTCNHCGNKNKLNINLSQLKVKDVDYKILNQENEYIFEAFNINLPENLREQSKIIFTFKLLTHKDNKELEKEIKQAQKIAKNTFQKTKNFEYRMKLKKMIKKIEIPSENRTIDNSNEIYRFISDELPNIYTTQLLKYANEISPGIDTRINFVCESCGMENTIPLPLDYFSFFLPERAS